jgi:hypothetical protein
MKRATQTASKRKPKTRVITDAPRAVEVAATAQISGRRKPPRAA